MWPSPAPSWLDVQALEGLLQGVVVPVQQQTFLPDRLRAVALAVVPQHFAQVRGDFRIGAGLVGGLEDANASGLLPMRYSTQPRLSVM